MVLLVNDKEVCTSDATYANKGAGNEPTLTGMTPCKASIPLKKGDTLAMQSVYDLASHPM